MGLKRPGKNRNSQNANRIRFPKVDILPALFVDLRKITANARAAVTLAGHRGIDVYAVTKGCAAAVPVARAMLEGGVVGLADSRLKHLKKLRAFFPDTPLLALRQPMRRETRALLSLDAAVIISDPDVIRTLDQEARRTGRRFSVVLMVEGGDGREGIEPGAVLATARTLAVTENVRLAGLAINSGCLGGREPDRKVMALFDKIVGETRAAGFALGMVSAGNSSCLGLLRDNYLAAAANHLRLGEAILLGREPVGGTPVRGFSQDGFVVRAEIIEAANKRGGRRLVTAIGCRDTGAGKLTPIDPRLELERLTSDHGVLTAPPDFPGRCGDAVDFIPSYFALQALATAPHVTKAYIGYNDKG